MSKINVKTKQQEQQQVRCFIAGCIFCQKVQCKQAAHFCPQDGIMLTASALSEKQKQKQAYPKLSYSGWE